MTNSGFRLTRRDTLLGLTAAVTLGRASLALADAPTDKRFIVVILRGALDGMSAVVPYCDPDLRRLRGSIVPPDPGRADGLLDLGGFYGMHPKLTTLNVLYGQGDLLIVHAIAGNYRSRSHFEAQDYLESGADHSLSSGWLNRAAGALPLRPAATTQPAFAVGTNVPLLLRGPTPVGNWAPARFTNLSYDLYGRIAALNSDDPLLGPATERGLEDRGYALSMLKHKGAPPDDRFAFTGLARIAGKLLTNPTGPRIAALEVQGWDTHTEQPSRLVGPLTELNDGMLTLQAGLGDVWKDTVVLVVTEFGRTVRVNGDLGTDHGTGTVAFVMGGAVKGGQVRANWPGLKEANLFENRDLQPTADLRSLAKGLLAEHLGLSGPALESVFPASGNAPPMAGLLRSTGTAKLG